MACLVAVVGTGSVFDQDFLNTFEGQFANEVQDWSRLFGERGHYYVQSNFGLLLSSVLLLE